MKTRLKRSIISMLALIVIAMSQVSQAVNVEVYSGYGIWDGTPFSGLVGTLTSDDIMFATDTGYAWHPFDLPSFGAKMTGWLDVLSDGAYDFALNSDDGSTLYIDDVLVVNNGGGHPPTVVNGSIWMSRGLHPFVVNFFEDYGGYSGVDLHLPSGVNYGQPVPDAGNAGMLISMALGLVGISRRFFARG